MDPGSRQDFAEVQSHLLEHIGDLSALRMFSINHQDPDVVGNVPEIIAANPRITGMTSKDTWRLVRHLNAQPKRLVFMNKAPNAIVLPLKGQQLQVVPTPFCHFRGAMAIYDPESRILFSGDLFGGLNAPGRVHLYGEEADWPGIAQFHQIYMPTRAALAHAIRQIRALKPAVKVIETRRDTSDQTKPNHCGFDCVIGWNLANNRKPIKDGTRGDFPLVHDTLGFLRDCVCAIHREKRRGSSSP